MDKLTQHPVKRLGPGDDLEMINTPSLWPTWPFLPVKRYEAEVSEGFHDLAMLQLGVIWARRPTTVMLGCLWLTDFAAPDAKHISYSSVEELLAASWRVD